MDQYDRIRAYLKDNQESWLITGVAGFIGSNLLEELLKLDQTVVGLDNFATGHQHNLDELQRQAGHLGLNGSVHFLGWVSEAELRAVVAAADLAIWQRQFGTLAGSLAAVPEPPTAVMLTLCLLLGWVRASR